MALPISDKWRLFFPVSGTPASPQGGVDLSELTMAGYVGGPSLCTGGVASCRALRHSVNTDGTYTYYPPEMAFDGLVFGDMVSGGGEGQPHDGMFWSAYGGTDQWLQYTFPSPVSIAEYGMAQAYGGLQDQGAGLSGYAWEFQYWNGTTWVAADTQTGQLLPDGMHYFAINAPATVRVIQQAVEVLRFNGVEKDVRLMQQAVEVLRFNGAEAGGGVIDPIPGENPAATTWFMMF